MEFCRTLAVLDSKNPWKWSWMEVRFNVFFLAIYFTKTINIIAFITTNTTLLQTIEMYRNKCSSDNFNNHCSSTFLFINKFWKMLEIAPLNEYMFKLKNKKLDYNLLNAFHDVGCCILDWMCSELIKAPKQFQENYWYYFR